MAEIKEFSKNWFKWIVKSTEEVKDQKPELTLHLLLNDLKNYIAHLDEIDSRRGRGMSPAKYAAIKENAKKGGWKKGVPRKKKTEAENGSDQ